MDPLHYFFDRISILAELFFLHVDYVWWRIEFGGWRILLLDD
jgi:hypothetical protein